MLTSQRKKLMLTRLTADGQIVARDLALELGTSEDTIRRDLRELAHEGKLQRVHGVHCQPRLRSGPAIREQVSSNDKIELGVWVL